MEQKDIFSKLGLELCQNCLWSSNKKLLGIVNPSAYLRIRGNKHQIIYAHGPLGYFRIDLSAERELIERLARCRFYLPCKEKDVLRLKELLEVNPLSRSVSYLINWVENFSELAALLREIAKAKVLIVGCGGVGSNTAYLLAGLGFKTLHLLDGDKIDITNLNRQALYTKADVGKFKVTQLKQHLLERFTGLTITTIRSFVDKKCIRNLTANIDIIVVSADSPPNVYQDFYNTLSGKVLFTGGYDVMDCVVAQFSTRPKRNKKKNIYVFPILDVPPSSGPLNFRVSAILAEQILRYMVTHKAHNSIQKLYFDGPRFAGIKPIYRY